MKGPFSNRYAGIYYDPKHPANLWDLQNIQQFLRSAARNVPRFADSLFEKAYPLMREFIDLYGSIPPRAAPGYEEYHSRMFLAIREWARTFHIEENWIIDEAYGILFLALTYVNQGIDPLEAFGTWWRDLRPADAKREFLLPAWNPFAEARTDFIKRADRAWKELRDDYLAKTTTELAAAGHKQVPARRKRSSTEELRFEWAVKHRCGGVSIEELAEQYQEDTEVVRIAVTRILNDLALQPQT